MALAAVILSGIAIVVSGLSAEFTRRGTRATQQLRVNDDARLYKERRPAFRAVMYSSPDRWDLGTVCLELLSAEPVDRLHLATVDASALVFGPLGD